VDKLHHLRDKDSANRVKYQIYLSISEVPPILILSLTEITDITEIFVLLLKWKTLKILPFFLPVLLFSRNFGCR